MTTDLLKRSIAKFGKPPTIGHAVPLFHHELDDGAHWHEGRKIGGSDASKAMGLHAYGGTPRRLYLEKIGLAESFAGNYATEYGSYMEEFGRIQFRKQRMGVVEVPWSWRHPEHPWRTCNLDGLTEDGGQGEVKCWGDYVKGDLERLQAGEPVNPATAVGNAVMQMQHNLSVMGLTHSWLIAMCGKRDIYFIRVEHNEALAERILKDERTLWENHIAPALEDMTKAGELAPQERGPDIGDIRREWNLEQLGERVLPSPDAGLVTLLEQYDALKEATKEPASLVAELDAEAKEVRARLEKRASLYRAKKLVLRHEGKKRSITLVERKDGSRSTRIT
jgi:predicted phage-related endonuclease